MDDFFGRARRPRCSSPVSRALGSNDNMREPWVGTPGDRPTSDKAGQLHGTGAMAPTGGRMSCRIMQDAGAGSEEKRHRATAFRWMRQVGVADPSVGVRANERSLCISSVCWYFACIGGTPPDFHGIRVRRAESVGARMAERGRSGSEDCRIAGSQGSHRPLGVPRRSSKVLIPASRGAQARIHDQNDSPSCSSQTSQS